MASFVVKQFGFVSGALADPINLTGSDQISLTPFCFIIFCHLWLHGAVAEPGLYHISIPGAACLLRHGKHVDPIY